MDAVNLDTPIKPHLIFLYEVEGPTMTLSISHVRTARELVYGSPPERRETISLSLVQAEDGLVYKLMRELDSRDASGFDSDEDVIEYSRTEVSMTSEINNWTSVCFDLVMDAFRLDTEDSDDEDNDDKNLAISVSVNNELLSGGAVWSHRLQQFTGTNWRVVIQPLSEAGTGEGIVQDSEDMDDQMVQLLAMLRERVFNEILRKWFSGKDEAEDETGAADGEADLWQFAVERAVSSPDEWAQKKNRDKKKDLDRKKHVNEKKKAATQALQLGEKDSKTFKKKAKKGKGRDQGF